jgi:flagellin
MSMVVNQNLSAMNSHHYMKTAQSSFGKAVERLSSGLRINRAADDPAGLVISEKFRAQVDGLKQAIKNAKDGISLVQTAEGALDEVAGVLRSMRNLALHAANTGTTDPAAAAADQAQIQDAIATLNRIANTTSFGTTKLLNGQSGVSATVAQPDDVQFISGTTATKAGEYAVDVTAVATQGVRGSASMRTVSQAIGNQTVDALAKSFAAANDFTDFKVTQGGKTFTIALDDTSGPNGDGTGVTKAWMISELNSQFAENDMDLTALQIGNNIVIRGSSIDAGDTVTVNVTSAHADGQGKVRLLTGFDATVGAGGANTVSTGFVANASDKLGTAETLTFQANATASPVAVNLTAGMTIQQAVDTINNALQSNSIRATASFDTITGSIQLQNNEYGSTSTVGVRVTSSVAAAATNTGLSAGEGTTTLIAAGGGVGEVVGADVAGTIGGHAATGAGQILTGNAGTNVEGLALRIMSDTTGLKGDVTVTQGSLNFQIGAFANETVTIQLQDLRSDMLGASATGLAFMSTVNVTSIDVTAGGGKGAQDAVLVLDAAIEQVSTMRAQMGAFQKDTLEASVRNLGVAAQNMASSESAIRDADMAEEMMNFSRAQILQQTSMAMLAQANQAPQMIMRLFQ